MEGALYSAAIIVFRETLEAALIVTIVLAATKGLPGSKRWIAAGLVAGLIGAAVVALLANSIAQAVEGVGQELFNAAILFAAVIMLGWHNVWMQQHGREMSANLKAASAAVRAGERSLAALAIVVGIAVLREGSETVLFLYGIATAGTGGWSVLLGGGLIGVLAGVVVGVGLYFGLLSIPHRYLFGVTSALVLFIAAGLAAQAVNFLAQADILPPLGGSVWNTSSVLDERSIAGRVLHTLIGYSAQPTPLQLIAYLLTLVVIGGLMLMVRPGTGSAKAPAPAVRS